MIYKPKSQYINQKVNAAVAALVFLGSLLVYYLTLARSLSFWDAGEYITCSSILGVPHPPGNPFYILLGRFISIFSGNVHHAFTVNFLSAIFSALAAMLTYLFTVKIITIWFESKEQAIYAYVGGFVSAVFIAFSYTFWTNAIEAEVYSGLAFIINLIAWLTLVWLEKSDGLSHQNILLLIVYIFFLGFGIHQTSLQIAPAVLFVLMYYKLHDTFKTAKFWKYAGIYLLIALLSYLIFNFVGARINFPGLSKNVLAILFFVLLYAHLKGEVEVKTWLFAFFLIVVGLSTHYFLFIRSELRPFINEGNPHNLELFSDYIFRRQYGPTSMFERRASFIYQMKDQFLEYFSWQFFHPETISRWFQAPLQFVRIAINLIVTFLGLGGAYYHFKKNRHSFAFLFSFFFMSSIAMVFVMNLSDAEVRVRDYFFVTAYNFYAVWLGIGAIALIAYFKKKHKSLSYLAMIIMLALPLVNLASQYFIHDRSNEYIALDYGQNILNSVEENAIIFTNGDNDTFPVWYAQAVYDPAASEFIHPTLPAEQDPEAAIYPTAKTKEIIAEALAYKASECSGIRQDVSIANLSLLNTPWYIEQLRDLEGIEFNIPQEHISSLMDNPRSALYPRQLPQDVKVRIASPNPENSFTVTIPAGTILYTKDLAVLQIIRDNYGKRPIYFAVTTPPTVGFQNHLRKEGMVDRLVPTKQRSQFNIERLVTNIDSVYSYRGIFDDSIYKDPNMLRLLNNYGAAFMNASRYYHSRNDFSRALSYMEKTLEFAPNNRGIRSALSQLYSEAGYLLLEKGLNKDAYDHLENSIFYDRQNKNQIPVLVQAAIYSGEYEKSIILLNKIRPYHDEAEIDTAIRELMQLESQKNK